MKTSLLYKAKNTYNLPEGAALQKVLVKFFREQRQAILKWLQSEHRKFLPFALPQIILVECKLFPPAKIPSFDHFGLGNKELARRVRPHIAATWEDTGTKVMAKLRAARVKNKMHRKDLGTFFDVTNPKIAQAIDMASFRFAKSTNDSTSLELDDAIDKLRESMIEGMEEGDTLSALTDRVKEVFDGAEDYRAERIANTESSRAYHEAQSLAAEESDVVTGFQWLASDAACEQICLAIVDQAEYMKLGEPFAIVDDDPDYGTVYFPPAHPNCCLPETPIIAPVGVAGVRAEYNGPVVRIRCSDGTDVTVTPNHMLLTIEGFTRASKLVKGDDVIRYCGPIDRLFSGNPNYQNSPPAIEEFVRAFSKSTGMKSSCVPVASENLHGDAAFCQSHVYVVASDRLLRNHNYSKLLEEFCQLDLSGCNVRGSEFLAYRSCLQVLDALRGATDRGMGRLRERLSLLRAQLRLATDLSGRTSSSGDSSIVQAILDGLSGCIEGQGERQLGFSSQVAANNLFDVDAIPLAPSSRLPFSSLQDNASLNEAVSQAVASQTNRLCDVLHRFSGLVSTCEVTDIEFSHYQGPVYDVQTLTSLYFLGNGIASSNCMCTVVEVLDTDDQPEWGETFVAPPPSGKGKKSLGVKFNPYHDERGRFAEGPGDSGGNYNIEHDPRSNTWHIMDGEYEVSSHGSQEDAANEVFRLGMVDQANKLQDHVTESLGKLPFMDNATPDKLDARISALKQAIQAIKPEVADQIAQDMANVAARIAGSSTSTSKPRFSVREQTDETGTHYVLMDRGRVSERFGSQADAQSALNQTVKFYQSEKLANRLGRYIDKLPGIDESDVGAISTRISSLNSVANALAGA